VAVGWALVAIAALALAGPLDLLSHRPGGAAFGIAERPIFMAMFAVGVIVALRWQIMGGAIAGFTAAGLVVFADQQLKPASAIIVVAGFAVPALLWIVIDLNDQRPRKAMVGLVIVSTAIIAGGVIADQIYDDIFGPTHPGSTTAELDESALDWIWSGAVTQDSFSVTAKLDDRADSIRLAISEQSDFNEVRLGDLVAADDHGLVHFTADGLAEDRTYYYAVETDGQLDLTRTGRIRTFPSGPSSFEVAIGSDARVGSNGAVFDAIREIDPLLYLIPGDLHYGDVDEPERGLFEDVLDLTLQQPAQAALYRSTPVAYVWDDHDFAGDGSGPSTPSAPVAHESFRRYVPHYPLATDTSAIYQAFTIGRVRFILTDGRSARSDVNAPDDGLKSMLGKEQKAWFQAELLDASNRYPLIVWVNPLPWISAETPGADDWGGYATERRELADFIADNDIDGLVMVSGDAHMVAIDDGSNSDFTTDGSSGFPVIHAAALDRPGAVKGGPYSHGTVPGGGHFGVLTVDDQGGSTVTVTISGRTWEGEVLMSHEFSAESPASR